MPRPIWGVRSSSTLPRRRRGSAEADQAVLQARAGVETLRRGGRAQEAALVTAFDLVMHDRFNEAMAVLDALLAQAPPGFAGWTIPIEPFFSPIRELPAFKILLRTLADRAR